MLKENLKAGRLVLACWLALLAPSVLSLAAEDDSMVAAYKKAVAADPKDVISLFNLALAYYKLEQFPEAKETLERCLQLNRGDLNAHKQVDGPANQMLGIIYYSREKQDQRAIEAFTRSLEYLPNDADTYYDIGLAYLRMKDYAHAVKAFKTSGEKGRALDAEVYYHMGRAYTELGDDPSAEASYRKALEIKPAFQDALEALGLLLHRQKRDEQAVQVLKRIVALDPMNFNANYLLGLHYYQKKMYPEMVTAFTKAVTVKPDLADAHYNLGMAYFYQTRYDQAIESLKKTVTLNPQDAEAFNLLGQAQTAAVEMHLQKGSLSISKEQYPDAILEFQKVLQLDPNHHKAAVLLEDTERKLKEELEAHLNLADNFYKEGRLEDAYNEYELALKLSPDSQPAQDGMTRARVELGQLLARKLQKGKAAEKSGDYAGARQYFESVLHLQANHAMAKQALKELQAKVERLLRSTYEQAQAQSQAGRLLEAAKRYQRIKELSGVFQSSEWEDKAVNGLSRVNARKSDLIHQYLEEGKQAFKNKLNPAAQKSFNRVLALDPQNKTANDYIMKLTGSQSQVTVTAEKIKEMYYKGVDLYVKGQIEEAIRAWKDVIAMDPENQDAQINIERAQSKLAAIRKLTGSK